MNVSAAAAKIAQVFTLHRRIYETCRTSIATATSEVIFDRLNYCLVTKTSASVAMNLPGLTSQRHSALISSESEKFQVCFSAVHYLKISPENLLKKALNNAENEKFQS